MIKENYVTDYCACDSFLICILFKRQAKAVSQYFYIGAAVVTIVIFSLRTVAMPQFVRQNIVGIFAKGTIGTAFFIIVMITGALPRGSKLIGTAHADSRGIVHYGGNSGAFAQPDLRHDVF